MIRSPTERIRDRFPADPAYLPPEPRAVTKEVLVSAAQVNLSEPLLTVRQAARLLSVSPRTLYSWTESDRLPCVRIGRLIRFELTALEEFVLAQQDAWQ